MKVEPDVGAAAVIGFDGPYISDWENRESALAGMRAGRNYLKNADGLVPCPLVKYVQIARKRQGYDLIAFGPCISYLLVRNTRAQCPGRNSFLRFYVPFSSCQRF